MKRLILDNTMYEVPLIVILGSRPNGIQRVILDILKVLGIGSGRNLYQPDCKKPDYLWLSKHFPFLAGYTIDRDWKILFEMFPEAKFILVMHDESSRIDSDEEYYETIKEYMGHRVLCIYSTDANLYQTISSFIGLSEIPLPIKSVKEVHHITLVERIKRFAYATAKWTLAGKPVRTLDEVRYLYDTYCSKCDIFDNDSCGICGCRIKRDTLLINKLAWGTESCPWEPPKWEANIKVDNSELNIEEIEKTAQKEIAKQKPEPISGPSGRKCCGG